MKTIFIFDQCDAGIKFFVLDGDFSHLDKVYINSCGLDEWTDEQHGELETKMEELTQLLYWPDGNFKFLTFSEFPVQDVLDGAKVIVAGFLP
jgi:hypothetical protein